MIPKISVFITSYNQRDFLSEAIESVMTQTLRPFEVIIADDCSSDGSRELITNYAARYPGLVKAYLHDNNLGIAKNKAFAQKQVRGDWLTYLDGDDRFLPRKLEYEFQCLEKTPDTRIAYSDYYVIDPAGKRMQRWSDGATPPSGYIFPEVYGRSFHRRSLFRCELIARECLDAVGYYDEDRLTHEDWDFKIRLTRHFRAVYCPEPLTEYRTHGGGISQRMPAASLLREILAVCQKNLSLLDGLPASEQDMIRTNLAGFLEDRANWAIRKSADAGQIVGSIKGLLEFRDLLTGSDIVRDIMYVAGRVPLSIKRLIKAG
ncbi:MAG: glycosyltransferase [Nitrospirae bacterium]|nr:glycosyltransferase [Nitrospirota bacterium]